MDELVEELAFTLAKIRYARAVIADVRGDPERGEEVVAAIRELGND